MNPGGSNRWRTIEFQFFFVLPVLLLERGGWTQRTQPTVLRATQVLPRDLGKKKIGAKKKQLGKINWTHPAKKPIQNSAGVAVFRAPSGLIQAYLLGLLAKIKCSICSYQLNLWYLLHVNK